MKKYTKEQIEAMREEIRANLDDALDVLADLEETEKERKKGKSEVVAHKILYNDQCITDYREKPYQLFLKLFLCIPVVHSILLLRGLVQDGLLLV